MDIASKIKMLKADIQSLDSEKTQTESSIKELKELVETRRQKLLKIEELKKQEASLLELL